MNTNDSIALAIFITAVLFLAGIGFLVFSPTHKVPLEQPILSRYELQDLLHEKGYYNGETDGIIGKLTIDAWDRCYNDMVAEELGGE